MIVWKPKNVIDVLQWKIAMVLSKGYERILIGSHYNIKQVLSGKKSGNLFYDANRPVGEFLIHFEDDRTNGKWKEALLYLKEAQGISTLQKIIDLAHDERRMVTLEGKAQSILQEKYDTGDPICQFVAIRIWYTYWGVRQCENADTLADFFDRMENLIRPFYRCDEIHYKSRRVLPDDPIFRWPEVFADCDERMMVYKQELKGTDSYIIADDSLIPLKQYYMDSLEKWRLYIIRCETCGTFFVTRSLRNHYCGASCRNTGRIVHREARMRKEDTKEIEKICRNGYQYWYNRISVAQKTKSWSEDELYDLNIAFDKFKDQKVLMRQKHKHEEITLQELNNWFISQRDVIDAIVAKHGK